MPRIFLSHSSEDNRAASAVRQWLVAQDPSLDDDIFLDIDPRNGMVGGERWKQTLLRRLASAEAMLCLVSQTWEAKAECVHEYRGAEDAGKQIFCARLESSAGASVSAWQWRDIFVGDGHDVTEVDIGDGKPALRFSTDGLGRLLRDVQTPDLGPRSFPWPPPNLTEREPYRGWLPFESSDAGVFFGRDTEISRALKTLRDIADDRANKLFVVLGASGTGKSSLLRAGLLPRLRYERRRFAVLGTIRPGRGESITGKMGLANAIFEGRKRVGLTSPPLGEIKSQWVNDTAKVRQLLMEILQEEQGHSDSDGDSPMLVLPVDQAEELFSAEAGPEGAALLAMLRDLMTGVWGEKLPLVTVVTIRTDRYAAMQKAPEFAVMEMAFDDLRPMPLGRFREVIEGPAARSTESGRRLTIDNSLVNHLFAEAANVTAGGDSLPLLSLTLHRMYLDYGSSERLSLAQFDEMGGMANVVGNELDRLLSRDPDTRRQELALLKDAFVPWLATVSDQNQPMRRIAVWSDIPEASREVVSRFVDARLLVRDRRRLGADSSEYQDVVEVALESLLRLWPDLAQWLSEQRDDLKEADHLLREASAWRADNRDPAYLFEGTLLEKAESLCASPTFARKLEPVRDFVTASRQRESERQRQEAERQEEKRRHAEAELEAAREQQQAAERYSAVLKRRDRILRAVLALAVVIACVAVAAFFWALNSRSLAQQREQDATAQKLVAEAQGLLADARDGDDVEALNKLLAAHKLESQPIERPLLDASVNRYAMHKVLDVGAFRPVVGVAFANHRLAMAEPRAIRYWDTSQPDWQETLQDDRHRLEIGSDAANLSSVSISPDGKTVAAGDEVGSVWLWDVSGKDPVPRSVAARHEGRVTSVAFSSDGRMASGGVDGLVNISNLDGSGRPTPISTGPEIFSVAFSPSGDELAIGRADGTVQLWDVHQAAPLPKKQKDKAHVDGAMSVAFSPDGRFLASGGADNKVRLWNATTLDPLGEMSGHTAMVTSVAFSDDSTRLVSGSNDKTVQLWDVATRARIGDPMRGHAGLVLGVDFVADGNEIVSGGNEHTMRLWDADIGQPLSTPITSRTGPVTGVAVSPDGRQIASGGNDGKVRLWSADTGSEIDSMTEHKSVVTGVAFDPVAHVIASSSIDGTVKVWRPDTHSVTSFDAGRPLTSVEFDTTGNRIAAAGMDGQVLLWDLRTAATKPLLLENKDHAIVYGVAFDPRQNRLASVSASGYLRMWDLAGRTQLWERDVAAELPDTFRTEQNLAAGYPVSQLSVAFSPDGQRVASGGVGWATTGDAIGVLQRWNSDNGDRTGDPIQVGNAVMGIAFVPEAAASGGDQIVVASFDPYEVQLWDTDAATEAKFSFFGHQAQVVSVAIDKNGRRIVSGSADGSVRVWPNLPTGPAEDTICAKLTANMSEDAWKDWVSNEIPYQVTCPGIPPKNAQEPH